jgi:hypothetical protein
MIATNLGVTTNQVRVNDRRLARVFLIDPALEIGASGGKLPYAQTINGSRVVDAFGEIIPPVNPRLMILSSLSQPLPATVVSGVASSTTAFNNIWDAPEGTIPPGWTWSGKGEDLKVQRIHLADLFVALVLNVDATTPGKYAIDSFDPLTVPVSDVPPVSPPFTAYFFDSTLLRLYSKTDVFQYSEILHQSKSFFSVFGSFQGKALLGKTITRPGPQDLQRAADAFTASSTNKCAGRQGVTPWTVYYGMIAYMSNYVNWADSGYQGCTPPCGNGNPSGFWGAILNGNQNQFGSQAYLNDRANTLICQQAN